MILSRLAGLALVVLAAYAPAGAEPIQASATITAPAAQPAPAARPYWPIVTGRTDWNTVSSQTDCVRLRCFEAPRPVSRLDNPQRHHAGVDLFANPGDAVIAVEDGTIIGFYPFLRARTGEMSFAILVAHGGYVANYGEVRENSLATRGLDIGSHVRAGQEIASVSDTSMLHFETYQPGTRRNYSWRYHEQRPAAVIDPTPRLQALAVSGQRMMP